MSNESRSCKQLWACHLIALGGTGQKALEMLTYACACDALYALDDDLRRVPPDTLSCAHRGYRPGPRTVRRRPALPGAAAVFSAAAFAARRLSYRARPLSHLPVVDAEQPDRYRSAFAGGSASSLLTQTLVHPDASASWMRAKACADMPSLGHVFLCRRALPPVRTAGAGRRNFRFSTASRRSWTAGTTYRVLLIAGSVYGGTGMSGIPSMARFLRGRYGPNGSSWAPRWCCRRTIPRTGRFVQRARCRRRCTATAATALMRHSAYDPDPGCWTPPTSSA